MNVRTAITAAALAASLAGALATAAKAGPSYLNNILIYLKDFLEYKEYICKVLK